MGAMHWATLGLSSPLTKGVVHFFPSSERVSAPFSVSCTISLFGHGALVRSIALEGARLHHPDGVRVEELFEELGREITGLYGLLFEIDGGSQSADVASSSLLSEIRYQGDKEVRFFVPPMELSKAGARTAIVLRDAHLRSSIIVVNPTSQSQEIVLLAVTGVSENPHVDVTPLQRTKVAGWSVTEIDVVDAVFDHGIRSERGLQRLISAALRIECEGASAEVGYYVVYRDGVSGSVVSIASIT